MGITEGDKREEAENIKSKDKRMCKSVQQIASWGTTRTSRTG